MLHRLCTSLGDDPEIEAVPVFALARLAFVVVGVQRKLATDLVVLRTGSRAEELVR